jgi:pre-mRNA-splicing factor SYF1
MLRIKRSVQAQFNTDVNFIASQAVARQQELAQGNGDDADEAEMGAEKADAMAALERQARAPVGFVAASSGPEGGNRPPKIEGGGESAGGLKISNADEIDIDDDI